MSWLFAALLSYLLMAVAFLVDKYLLNGPLPNPKVYTFFVGILGALILVIAPFAGFYFPEPYQIISSLAAGALFILGLFWFYKALYLFEVSRAIPAIGGILPLFTFLLIFIFSGGKETLKPWELLSFFLMISGSVLITWKKSKEISLESLKISAFSAFFLALSFVISKYVYMVQPFWVALIWLKIGGGLTALTFLLFLEVRKEVLKEKEKISKKTAEIFLLNQTVGAGANILQNWAIALSPLVLISLINALQGIQYVFLLILTIFLSLKFPKILKEEISKEILFQKIIAILLIGAGLIILASK